MLLIMFIRTYEIVLIKMSHVKQQAFTWTNVDPVFYRHKASLGQIQ